MLPEFGRRASADFLWPISVRQAAWRDDAEIAISV
jgi:hypothetical protein